MLHPTAIIFFVSLLPVCLGCSRVQQGHVNQSTDALQVNLVGEQSNEINGRPNSLVEVRCNVMNLSDRPLIGVSPKLPCNCQIKTPLPSMLSAGQSGELEFSVRVPFAGTQDREIPFFDETGKSVGRLQLTVQAAGAIPRIASSTNPFQTYRIIGEPGQRQFEVKTVEPIGAPNWLHQMKVDNGEVAVVTDVATRDIPSFDQKYVERRYRVTLDIRMNELGSHSTALLLKTNEENLRIPLIVDVRDRALAVPSAVILNKSEPKKSVTLRVISRVAGESYVLRNYDDKLTDVRQSDSSDDQQWLVTPVPNSTMGVSEISFVSSSNHVIHVPVSIEP